MELNINKAIHRYWKKLSRFFSKNLIDNNRLYQKAEIQAFIRDNLSLVTDIVAEMAETGVGTDECLAKKCLPMRVHYYWPIPDIEDLEKRQIWGKRSALTGIDFHPDRQINLVRSLGREYGHECIWPTAPTADETQFYLRRDVPFAFSDAAILHGLIRQYKPKRVIEIGSGGSSRVISAALHLNHQDTPSCPCEYTIVDPYPAGSVKSKLLFGISRLVEERMELTDISLYEQLQENDILFIDGSHNVRIGGDVNFAILDVLPRLKPGVLVHFHDIPMPHEYPKIYYTGQPAFRVFWTESYLLQAFLACNDKFEVLMALSYFHSEYSEQFHAAFPQYDPSIHAYTGSGFWIRCVA